MLRTKTIISQRSAADGVRISVMSRHTLSDGKTPDSRISADKYDEWWRELAPPASLIGAYYKRGLSWPEFTERFLEYLRMSSTRDVVERLMTRALREDVTLLCIEPTPEQCHRRLVAEECVRLCPHLPVFIR